MREDYSKSIKIGEHGFVRFVDVMGNDAAIVQAARVSYGAGTKSVTEDKNLIEYLLRNGHTSPFEMIELKLHISATIFEARQLVRHRMASWNELSGRYSELPGDFWVPAPEDIRAQGKLANKQSSGGELEPGVADAASEVFLNSARIAYTSYQMLLEAGVAREQARAVLPVSLYTQWYWKVDGNNLLKILALRDDSHAQAETQALARAIKEIATDLFPWTMEAYEECVRGAARFTKSQLDVLETLLTQGYHSSMNFEDILEARLLEAGQPLRGTRLDDFKKAILNGRV